MTRFQLVLSHLSVAPRRWARRQRRLRAVRRPQERKWKMLSPRQTDRIVTTSLPPSPRLALTLAGTTVRGVSHIDVKRGADDLSRASGAALGACVDPRRAPSALVAGALTFESLKNSRTRIYRGVPVPPCP